jgi:hypothetical protein
MAPTDRAVWAEAHEAIHIYGGTRDGGRARARAVWTNLMEHRTLVHLTTVSELH